MSLNIFRVFKFFVFLGLAWSQSHCGGTALGGTEAGNPQSTRIIIGNFVRASNVSALHYATDDCGIDTLKAEDSQANVEQTSIDTTDCSFEIEVPAGTSYKFRFEQGASILGFIYFDNRGDGFESDAVVVSEGTTIIDLGEILWDDSGARPSRQLAEQNDLDDDGIPDYLDDDDDNDGVDDRFEEDCDFDGHLKDFDDDDVCDSNDDGDDDNHSDDDGNATDEDSEDDGDTSPTTQASYLQIRPSNGSTGVSRNPEIEARAGCPLDSNTLTGIRLEQLSNSQSVALDCELEDDGDTFECELDDDALLAPSTSYQLTLENGQCENGDTIPTTSITFTTRS